MITDPQSVLFVNTVARPLSDALVKSYWLAKIALSKWATGALVNTITNTSDQIGDGAAQDGRTVVTGGDIVIQIAQVQNLVNQFEAANNLILNQLSKPAVNTTP